MRLTLILCLSLLSLVRGAEDLPEVNQLVDDKEVLEAEETVRREASEERRLTERLAAPESTTQQSAVEYANDERKTSEEPASQNYVTTAPGIGKISDVLTTQGIPFPAAIAKHLISPVSIYQSRLPAPHATYDVSPPIPAQLAYSEHRIYQPPPQQNSLQYYAEQKPIPNQGFLSRLPINFNLQGPAQNVQYYQSVIPQQQPHLIRVPQQQIFQYQIPPPLQYNQPQNLDLQRPIQYSQTQQQPLYNIVFNRHNNVPPGIMYARQEENANDNRNPAYTQPQQQERSEPQGQQNQLPNIPQAIPNVDKSQGAVSYASFSQSPPSYVPQRNPTLQFTAQKAQPQNINLNIIPNDRLLPIQSAPFIIRTQQNLQNYPLQNIQQLSTVQQLQGVQQLPHPIQHLPQQQLQYISRHSAPGNLPPQSQQYLLQIPQFQQFQPLQPPQIYQLQPNYDPRPQQGYLIPEQQQQRPQTAPNYLPVQFFGKFAEKIFARYNENERK